MIELVLSKIKVDETRNEQVIVFKEKDGTRFLPVVIGIAEVNAIKIKLSGIKPPRPLTHDLVLEIVDRCGARLEKVVIDRLQQNTFYATLHFIQKVGEPVTVDARPSDSVALALRAAAPIFAADEVMGEAGVNEV
ncbi:MAG TPA: bifunctional nuclease family protein [bacterium]|nr:bifunctional nuclease family protein [bacterium]